MGDFTVFLCEFSQQPVAQELLVQDRHLWNFNENSDFFLDLYQFQRTGDFTLRFARHAVPKEQVGSLGIFFRHFEAQVDSQIPECSAESLTQRTVGVPICACGSGPGIEP